MTNPKVGEIVWLIKIYGKKNEVIGFLRGRRHLGALILGGATGTHCTGHGETWESKWRDFISSGYIIVSDAKKRKLIPDNWLPPRIPKSDYQLVEEFSKN